MIPIDPGAAKSDLGPRIRTRLSFEGSRRRAGPGQDGVRPSGLPSVPVGGHPIATMAYARHDAEASIDQGDSNAWGITLDEAPGIGLQDLRDSTDGYAQPGDGFYAFTAGVTHDAARMFLRRPIERMEVKGSHVAMAAGRDSLMVTGRKMEPSWR